jgi:hypothetical protein
VYLWLRMLYVFIVARFLKPLERRNSTSGLKLFGNGCCRAQIDSNSLDLFLRTGLFFHARANFFKKSLKRFQKFELGLDIAHWNKPFFYMTQKIVSDGIVYVDEKIKNVVWSRTGVIKPVDVWTSLSALRGRHHRITAIPSPGRACSAGPNAVVLSLKLPYRMQLQSTGLKRLTA